MHVRRERGLLRRLSTTRSSFRGSRAVAFVVAVPSVVALTVLTAAAVVAIQSRARGVDAVGLMETAFRLVRLGGSYYTTGSDPKGPLFQVIYHLAALLGGRTYAWWFVAVFAVLFAMLTAISIGRIVRACGYSNGLAIAGSVGLYIHLIITWNGYSGILYARNITIALLAYSLSEIVRWNPKRSTWRLVASGLAAGLAAQTILTEALAGVVFGVLLMYRLLVEPSASWPSPAPESTVEPAVEPHSNPAPIADAIASEPAEAAVEAIADPTDEPVTVALSRPRRLIPAAYWIGSAAFGLLAAPIWYLLRGKFTEFWYWWFTYSNYYADSTNQTTMQKVRGGWRGMRGFYRQETGQAMLLAVFVMVLVGLAFRRSAADRPRVVVGVALVGWWVAECAGVVAAQRFSPHHFVLVAVPVGAMGALLLARLFESVVTPGTSDPPGRPGTPQAPETTATTGSSATVLSGVLTLAVIGLSLVPSWTLLKPSWRELRHFPGFRNQYEGRLNNQDPDMFTARALVDLVTPANGFVWAWDEQPMWAGEFNRNAGSRYIESRVLRGYIYNGSASPKYLPPNAWANFQHDLERSKTVVVAERDTYLMPRELPGWGYIARTFTPAFKAGTWNLRIRTTALRRLMAPSRGPEARVTLPSTWRRQGADLVYLAQSQAQPSVGGFGAIDLATDDRCLEVTGTVDLGNEESATSALDLRFESPPKQGREFSLRLGLRQAQSNFAWFGNSQTFHTEDLPLASRRPFRFLIGRRAAALVVDGRIVAVSERPWGTSTVRLVPQPGVRSISDFAVRNRPDCYEG